MANTLFTNAYCKEYPSICQEIFIKRKNGVGFYRHHTDNSSYLRFNPTLINTSWILYLSILLKNHSSYNNYLLL